MSLYADDYSILETAYIVHACMVNPCDEHPSEQPEWLIGLLLHVGPQGHTCAMTYPSRALRDAAFEQIVALVRRDQLALDEEEEDV